jgi:hypothetical protein
MTALVIVVGAAGLLGSTHRHRTSGFVMRRVLLAAFALAVAATPTLAQQVKADAEALQACVDEKAGPEGDLPPSGPLREKFLRQMEGGPQSCFEHVRKPCMDAGGDADACTTREAKGWLKAVADVAQDAGRPEKNRAIWRAASGRLQAQAVATCEATAALSAWGSETVSKKGKFGMGLSHPCVNEAIARQAIILLTNVRGN